MTHSASTDMSTTVPEGSGIHSPNPPPCPDQVTDVTDTNKNRVVDGNDKVEVSDCRTTGTMSVSKYVNDADPAQRLARLGEVVSVSSEKGRTSNYVSGQFARKALGKQYKTVHKVQVHHEGKIDPSTKVTYVDSDNKEQTTTVGEYVKGNPHRLASVLHHAGKSGKEFGLSGAVIKSANE